HVVEAHRGRALAGRFIGERRRRRRAVGARANRSLDPREEIGETTRTVAPRSGRGVAIKFLIHLEETMHRAGVVSVVGVFRAGDLERAGRKVAGVLSIVRNSLVWLFGRLARAAG